MAKKRSTKKKSVRKGIKNVSSKKVAKKVEEGLRTCLDEIIMVKGNLGGVVYKFLDNIAETIACAATFKPITIEAQKRRSRELKDRLSAITREMKEKKASKASLEGVLEELLYKVIRIREKIRKSRNVRQSEVLAKSLFLNLFSLFDAFSGEVLKYLYCKREDLLKSVSITLGVEDIVRFGSVGEIKKTLIDREIESLKRENYINQFITLEKKFGVSLRKFDNWSSFIECAERRNIVMHCGGVVSEQYMKVCKRAGCNLEGVKIGNKLRIEFDYFFASAKLFQEVGFKLGQTLWRKLLPQEIEKADSLLMEYLYRLLVEERWGLAQNIGHFGVNLSCFSNDAARKVILVNYAIALKYGGHEGKMRSMITKEDWSATIDDFKLARAVLLDSYREAARLLRKIGEKGEYLEERSYKEWPLFREFRKTKAFCLAYRKVYGKEFEKELEKEIKKELSKKIKIDGTKRR